eukprot:546792-Pleurochrysis_carterae.AAC.2
MRQGQHRRRRVLFLLVSIAMRAAPLSLPHPRAVGSQRSILFPSLAFSFRESSPSLTLLHRCHTWHDHAVAAYLYTTTTADACINATIGTFSLLSS